MDGFIGEIRILPYNYAPANWAVCDGSLLSTSSHIALFSVIGKLYGGDGATTFALPKLNGRFPIGMGAGTGLTPRSINQSGGVSEVSLDKAHLPSHEHGLQSAQPSNAALASPGSSSLLGSAPTRPYADQNASTVQMNEQALGMAGGGLPHNNMPPYLALNFCICLNGEYPARQ